MFFSGDFGAKWMRTTEQLHHSTYFKKKSPSHSLWLPRGHLSHLLFQDSNSNVKEDAVQAIRNVAYYQIQVLDVLRQMLNLCGILHPMDNH